MPRDNEAQFLHDVLRGDAEAIRFCELIFWTSQTLDDLVDGDVDLTKAEIIRCFWMVLVELPGNTFYRNNMGTLVPMLQVFLQDWIDSTTLERGTEHEKSIAFVLRDTVGGLIVHAAHLVGGYEWAQLWAPTVRRHIHEDSLADYVKGLP